jgi:hypothetical protein
MLPRWDSYARILKALRDDSLGCTVRQLAIRTGGSYGWTHATCTRMIRDEILHSQRVGNAVLCSVNPTNAVVFPLLALISAQHTQEVLSANPELAAQARQVLASLNAPCECVLHTDKGFVVVQPRPAPTNAPWRDWLYAISPEELGTVLLPQATVLQNFELAWRLALKASRKDQ